LGGDVKLNKVRFILSDERGSAFIESGLWIGTVVLVMVGAGMALAVTINNNYIVIQDKIANTIK
jgi:Flp pilus assembly pilin Flp